MPIFGSVMENILEGLKRKDHVIFGLNRQGNYDPEGYRFVRQVIHDQGLTEFGSLGDKDLGYIHSVYDENDQVWYHGIVNHCLEEGWEYESYEEEQSALGQIHNKFEDSLVRPMRSLWLGRGKMRLLGEENGNLVRHLDAMANSGADLAIYHL